MQTTTPHVTLRTYPRNGRMYQPGDPVDLSPAAADAALQGDDPFVRPMTAEEIEAYELASGRSAARQEEPAAEPAPEPINATDGAKLLAQEKGFDLAPYAGQGSGDAGRILKADVEGWLASADAADGA